MKQIRGKTLVKVQLTGTTEIIGNGSDLGQMGVFNVQKTGSLFVANDIRRDYSSRYDPIYGEVVNGDHKGKQAWFHKTCYRESISYGNINHYFKGSDIGEEDGDYLSIANDNIFFYIVNDEIQMVPTWTLCEPIGDVDWEYLDGARIKVRTSTGGLILPAMNEDYKTDKAILRFIDPNIAKELGLTVGDVIYIDRACDIPVEDMLNMKLDKKYFRVETSTILGKAHEAQV